jgi:hypothetical protein
MVDQIVAMNTLSDNTVVVKDRKWTRRMVSERLSAFPNIAQEVGESVELMRVWGEAIAREGLCEELMKRGGNVGVVCVGGRGGERRRRRKMRRRREMREKQTLHDEDNLIVKNLMIIIVQRYEKIIILLTEKFIFRNFFKYRCKKDFYFHQNFKLPNKST